MDIGTVVREIIVEPLELPPPLQGPEDVPAEAPSLPVPVPSEPVEVPV